MTQVLKQNKNPVTCSVSLKSISIKGQIDIEQTKKGKKNTITNVWFKNSETELWTILGSYYDWNKYKFLSSTRLERQNSLIRNLTRTQDYIPITDLSPLF